MFAAFIDNFFLFCAADFRELSAHFCAVIMIVCSRSIGTICACVLAAWVEVCKEKPIFNPGDTKWKIKKAAQELGSAILRPVFRSKP